MRHWISDASAWSWSPDGLFSVGSLRRFLDQEVAVTNSSFDLIWCGYCPPKVEIFLWQLIRGRVMVKDVLGWFGFVPGKPDCVLCNGHVETIDHLFLHSDWSSKVWLACMDWWGIECCASESLDG